MSTPNVTPAPAPTDPRLAALTLQTQLLTQQQQQMDANLKIQQDQQTMLTGMLPASSAAPQSGAFTVSGTNPFDSQKLAYDVLGTVAAAIANVVAPKSAGPVLIYDQTEMNSLVNYKAVLKILGSFQDHVAHLKQSFNNDLDPGTTTLMALPAPAAPKARTETAAILIPGLLLGGLKTLSDLMGMFRTNTSIAFSSFTADDAALTAAVVNSLIGSGKDVYEPAMMPVDVTANASTFMDNMAIAQNDLVDLQERATEGQAKLQQLSDAFGVFLQADLALQANTDQAKIPGLTAARDSAGQAALGLFTPNAAQPAPDPLTGVTANLLKSQRDQFLKRLGLFVTSVAATVTAFNALQTSLLAVTNTGSATLTAILRAENLMAKMNTAGAAILQLKTSVLGGSVVTRQNLFTGGHLLYTGGAIVNFTLLDTAGKVIASGVVSGNTAEKTAKF